MVKIATAGASLLAGLLVVSSVVPSRALAQAKVGGHIGIAVPLLTVTSDDTTNIVDDTVIVNPIGVTVKLTERFAVDFETQIVSPVDPEGDTAFVVAPGLIYNAGPAALGLRVAWQIGAPVNVGVIPLVNFGIAPVGVGTWFVEAAFPTFISSEDPDVAFNVVLHTGIGF